MDLLPLTVPEARAILAADEALDRTLQERQASGQTLDSAEGEAWMRIVQSAQARVALYESANPEPQAEARTGYTTKRLTAEDAAHIAELLRVSIDDKFYLVWHPKLREIREKMIERMGDTHDQERTP